MTVLARYYVMWGVIGYFSLFHTVAMIWPG
jgi:hypothetical protein